ncbi:Tn3 family transposase, partial [Escherichia coli]|nr:Tn3 family transposase [Escherichia coli]
MGSCAAPSAKGDDKFITTDYLQQCQTLNDEDIARLSPLCHGHINMLGHYSFTLAELVTKGHLRPLKEASEAENVA